MALQKGYRKLHQGNDCGDEDSLPVADPLPPDQQPRFFHAHLNLNSIPTPKRPACAWGKEISHVDRSRFPSVVIRSVPPW